MNRKILRIGHLSTAYHSNFLMMGNQNLDQELKIPVEWSLFDTGPEIVKAFQQNLLDLGYMGLPPAIIGIDQGVPILCIAGGHINGTLLIGKKKYFPGDIDGGDLKSTFLQFKGKTIGVPSKGSIHAVILDYYINKFQLQDDIKINYYSMAELIAIDLMKDLIQGGIGTPALAVFAESLTDSRILIPPSLFWKNSPSYGIMATKELIEQDPDLIQKFISHHKIAAQILIHSRLEAAKTISNVFKMITPEYVKRILDISPDYSTRLSKEYIKASLRFVNLMFQSKLISRKLTQKDIFDLRFQRV